MKKEDNLKLKHEIKQSKIFKVMNLVRLIFATVLLVLILEELSSLNIYQSIFVIIIPLGIFSTLFYIYRDSYKIKLYEKGVKFSSYMLPKSFEDLYVDYKDINDIHKETKKMVGEVLIIKDIYGNEFEVSGFLINKILPYLHDNLKERWNYVYKGRGEKIE
ncbi:MAG: hypothetical protein R6W73_01005 [Candidatus Saliniplasma sp.]